MRASVLLRRGSGHELTEPLRELVAVAQARDSTLCFSDEDARFHGLADLPGVSVGAVACHDADVCLVLGGDGTILGALRDVAGTEVPVFAVNFGEVGFLATVDPAHAREGFELALDGAFDTMALPSVTAGRPEQSWTAFNDISVHRQPGSRVANLAYALGGEEIGRVRCDGLVAATPAGSTGYNLANGGPVLAWGVEGFVVSFIAPHSFTARALVVAPADSLTITNTSPDDDVEVHIDGRPACMLPPGQDLGVEFGRSYARLAQLPGATFYHRLRDRFGRLAS